MLQTWLEWKQVLKVQQEKQVEYFTILIMILGAGTLGYGFIKKKEDIA